VTGPPRIPATLIDADVLSDIGRGRPDNQDCGRHQHLGPLEVLAVVADGVSGQAGGSTASQLAVESVFRDFHQPAGRLSLERRLARAAQRANIDVYDLAVTVTELRGMGTTLTALAIRGDALAAAHVGDSRLYLLRGENLVQLTKDHTVTGEKVRLGLLREARARHHPDRSTLTRCLGRELIVGLDRFTRKVVPGDTFVLCTDGLYNALDESEIARIVSHHDASSACRELVDAANRAGAPDNVTVSVVRVTPAPGGESNALETPELRDAGAWSRLRRWARGRRGGSGVGR
jgi:protein phosphatase